MTEILKVKLVFVVEPEEVDLPVFISKLTNFLGDENLLSYLTADTIEMKLLSLNSHKARDADKIDSHVIKAYTSDFTKPLKIIFTKLLIEEYVPKLKKEANVRYTQYTRIHKNGSITLAVNYRNVSLTSMVCRIQ